MDTNIGAFQAKTHLSALLDRVEKGEELTITRRGVPVARLVPVRPTKADGAAALRSLRALHESLRAEGFQPLTVEEILEARDADRKY